MKQVSNEYLLQLEDRMLIFTLETLLVLLDNFGIFQLFLVCDLV